MSALWDQDPPSEGDIVWCHFPEEQDGSPGPKPRPALVIDVEVRTAGAVVSVIYGTSQRVTSLKSGEFAISQSMNPDAYKLAGLSYDTKFNFRETAPLPWTEEFFKVPPRAPCGQRPKLGSLHVSLHRAAQAAFNASKRR